MNQVQRQYHKQLNYILRMKVGRELKLHLLQSFQQVLRQHNQIQAIVFNQSFNQISMVKSSQKPQIESTKFSQSLSMDTQTLVSKQDIQQLQQQILSKKIVKIQHYEQIEILQQQLYAIQDAVECKRKYNQWVRKEIDRKMIDIEEEKEKSLSVTRSSSMDQRVRHNKSFSDYLKSWWN